MSDQLLMDNYLMLLKSTVEVYVHGTLESVNENVRKLLKKGLDETIMHQANTYDKMTEFGWYTINNVDDAVISQTINNLDE
ncbi:MAG: spore coat protein [Bacilli bacterium]|nr:spore coat protein [Bacilli bacterium]